MISIVVPILYTSKKSYILERANHLINKFSNIPCCELVLIDSSKNKYLNDTPYKNVVIINADYCKGLYSPAKARNIAINYTTYEYLFFFDVDLDFDYQFIKSLLLEVKKKLKENISFLMIPCFYLSEEGTRYFEKSTSVNSIKKIRESFLIGENIYVDSLAVNTSAIVVNKKHFINIGMFSECFIGHGCEDFELLHRLFSIYPNQKRESDYYFDAASQFVADYHGFRKYMACYSLPYVFTSLVLVHKWHPRPLFNKFYLNRSENEKLLRKKMYNHDKQEKFIGSKLWESDTKINYDTFIKDLLCKHWYDCTKYIGFYRHKEGVVIKRPKSAKLRKLITRPKLYFKDMVKK